MSEVRDRDVAVIGMVGRFPGARDLDHLWSLLAAGGNAVTALTDDELRAAGVPDDHLVHPDYVKAASRLDGVADFDAGFFEYTAREAEIMDPQQRLFLEHAWAALENAGYSPRSYDGLIGVYAAVAWNTYLLANLRDHRELFDGAGGFQVFITNDKDFMPTRVSYKLDLKGPSLIIQTSCSSSLVGIHLAALSLLNYECDMALAGGVTVRTPQDAGYFHQEGGLASPDGHCRPFDADAAGTIFGSGVGVVVLKRLAEALDDGDHVRAVIRGSAINNDGSLKVSYTAPSVEGQAEAVAAAQAVAEVDPETIGYVECHGTGTSLGDPIEVTALTQVFRRSTEARGICALGSIKSNLGHLDSAAGVAGFIKTVLALEKRQIPPTANFQQPNPRLSLETSPFRIAAELSEWEASGGPRRAGVSSFGVGGTNAHVVLEEAPAPRPGSHSRRWQLLPVSARSATALDAATGRLAEALAEGIPGGGELADAAFTVSLGRTVFPHRRFLVARDPAEAAEALGGALGARLPTAADDGGDPRQRPVTFLLPGQGAQHPGMARELYDDEPVFRQALDRSTELLQPRLDLDLRQLLFASDPGAVATERLANTALAQPALFAVEHALAQLWRSWGIEPESMIGHSLGELVAATLAGVFRFEDALALVAERGRLMASAPAGEMLAVPMAAGEVEELLTGELAASSLDLAAINEPSRCSVSGPSAAIAELEAVLADRGVEARRLHTSHAFHSASMDEAAESFRDAAAAVSLSPPQIPFVSNLSGTWITAEEATDPGYWARHLRHPVQFADGLAAVLADSQRILLEVGPGTSLATLARRHPARSSHPVISTLPHPRQGGDAQESTLRALGRLWLAGREVDWAGFWEGEQRRRLPLPSYPFERRRYWIDPAPPGATKRPEAAAAGKRPDVASWFYRPRWEEAPRPQTAASERPPRWLVLTPGNGPAEALIERLSEGGAEVLAVEPADSALGLEEDGDGRWRNRCAIRPDEADDWRAMATRWLSGAADAEPSVQEGEAPPPLAIVHAWHLGAPPADGPAGFAAAQETGLLALLELLRALPGIPVDLTVVADRLFAVTAAEPLAAERAPLTALARVLRQERPDSLSRWIDPGPLAAAGSAASHRRLADRLLAEIDPSVTGGEVALRGDQRWLRRFRPQPLAPGDDGLRQQGVYLVTGAMDGNGRALARYLSRRFEARLLLAEDSASSAELDAEARDQRVAEIAAEGGQAHWMEIDLTDPEAVAGAIAEAERRFGPLQAVIHAADTYGERTFRVLAETGPAEAAWHFRPKVEALYALERALAGRDLDFVAVVSSLASELGGIAYCGYAAGCAAADAFVEEHMRVAELEASGEVTPWLALDWDVWTFEDGEGDGQITDLRVDLAELAMTPREGEDAFGRAIAAAAAGEGGRLLVSTEALPLRLARSEERSLSRAGAGTAAGERHPRPDLDVAFAAPEGDLETRIAEVWCSLLGFDRVGRDDNFFELGGDSFVAVRTAAQLREVLGVELPVAKLYEGLTVGALARLVEQEAADADERAQRLEQRREAAGRRQELLDRRRERIGAGR